jgi:preprotein translocase subunit SecA
MNQQREVIYSLRTFALEGGEELKGEALKMIDRAMASRVEREMGEPESSEDWDIELLQKQLLIHYMLQVPEIDDANKRPTTIDGLQQVVVEAAKKAFHDKLVSLDSTKDEFGQGYGDRLLSLVMLQVLDEKWKDHLYDLDQLRNAIHYRSWGQKDPLVEYKQEAYTMFVDLMNDIYNTFTEGFLKAQLRFEPVPQPPPPPPQTTRRYNAMGILEEIPLDNNGTSQTMDVGPAEQPSTKPVEARRDPVVVGAGKARSLNRDGASENVDWSTVSRNDPCPCGSGKKFKKCHGATL